jgi:hypothetical protein
MNGGEVPSHAYDSFKYAFMDLRTPQKFEPKKKYESLDEYMREEVFRKIEEKALRGGDTNWTKL